MAEIPTWREFAQRNDYQLGDVQVEDAYRELIRQQGDGFVDVFDQNLQQARSQLLPKWSEFADQNSYKKQTAETRKNIEDQ